MFRDILTNRWVLGGVGFLIVLSIACVLWYQHDIAPDKKAAAEAEELLRQSEIAKKVANTDSDMEQAADVSSVESNTLTAKKPITEASDRGTEGSKAEAQPQPAETPTDTADVSENAGVSPFGFGPYPEVPTDYIRKLGPPLWMRDISSGSDIPEHVLMSSELIGRVLVKLWTDGDTNIVGGSTDADGKVIPHYPNTIYVKIVEEVDKDTGTIDRTVHMRGPPGTRQYHEHIIHSRDVPSHITIVPWDNTVGIDPYTFLNLRKE